ncbi:MAG TPA: transglutaminase, partial [Firmicutes bacterium]|nr:transglutaminase [Bacillota bacterium]
MVYRFYAEQGIITEPGEYGDKLQDLPRDISALVKVVQGLLIHVFWAERYGLNLPEERKQEVQLRKVRLQLQRIFQLDERPLETPRPMEKRLAGNCRDFATLLCSFLRSQGIPARARCGFGAYFRPGTYEDQWVCEYWHAEQKRWVLVDAQLDDLQRDVLGIRFDALDVPRNEFIVGGKAWHWCRQGEADPNDF